MFYFSTYNLLHFIHNGILGLSLKSEVKVYHYKLKTEKRRKEYSRCEVSLCAHILIMKCMKCSHFALIL